MRWAVLWGNAEQESQDWRRHVYNRSVSPGPPRDDEKTQKALAWWGSRASTGTAQGSMCRSLNWEVA